MANPHDIIFSIMGPFNNNNSVSFTKEDSVLDLEKINNSIKDKTFLLFKDNILNTALTKGKLSFADLDSLKVVINIKQYDDKAQNIEVTTYQAASEGGNTSRLEYKHQFADASHAEVKKINFEVKDTSGNVLDSFESDHTSEDKTILDKIKSFFHLSNLNSSHSGNAISTTLENAADDWANGLAKDLQKFDNNLVSINPVAPTVPDSVSVTSTHTNPVAPVDANPVSLTFTDTNPVAPAGTNLVGVTPADTTGIVGTTPVDATSIVGTTPVDATLVTPVA